MRIYTLLAIFVVMLATMPAESFAGIIAPQRQTATVKKVDRSTPPVVTAPRQQVKQLLTKSPAY